MQACDLQAAAWHQLPWARGQTEPGPDVCPAVAQEKPWAPSLSPFIVRLSEYQPMAELERGLRQGLQGSGLDWAWQPRPAAAQTLPTDFAVIRARPQDVPRIEAQLRRRLPGFRDVHADGVVRGPRAAAAASVTKPPGRLRTRSSFELDPSVPNSTLPVRELLEAGEVLTDRMGAPALWARGVTGSGVKVGIFDTGLRADHPHIRNVKERTNWTHEPTLDDGLGHGSFVAGVIAGTCTACPGLAPDVEVYVFRVFTNDQVSYTSWFLDAFNYAIATGIDVVNLSIGGPDYLDAPFVDKVLEVTASGIAMVSAIGNDGPAHGTLNNPGDQRDVVGVGAVDYTDAIATFSSRGFTSWGLPTGVGTPKPDVVAYGRNVRGSQPRGDGCRMLSGTSVASPVVTGVVGLLASSLLHSGGGDAVDGIASDLPLGATGATNGSSGADAKLAVTAVKHDSHPPRRRPFNPGMLKQALLAGAERLPGVPVYEQGAGRVALERSVAALAELSARPRVTAHPAELDWTDCPYAWPHCRQPLYTGAMPTLVNLTLLNGMGLVGWVATDPEPAFKSLNEPGNLLDVAIAPPAGGLWPWSGHLGLTIRVRRGVNAPAVARGIVTLTVHSPDSRGAAGGTNLTSVVDIPLTIPLIPTPPREKRLLWDQFHSIAYPPAYIPRDDLANKADFLDWHSDHPYNNFHGLFDHLRDAGYFLEILGTPLTCFDASQYAALLVVDPEEEFFKEEVEKLRVDVMQEGLGLIVFADWYDEETVKSLRFYDDNTRSWWEAATGGSNVPALNDLLAPYGLALGSPVLEGYVEVPRGDDENGGRNPMDNGSISTHIATASPAHKVKLELQSATGVAAAPAGAWLYYSDRGAKEGQPAPPVLAMLPAGNGTVSVFGDSNCLDSSHPAGPPCWDLLDGLLAFAAKDEAGILTASRPAIMEPLKSTEPLPKRRADYDFKAISRVLGHTISCPSELVPFPVVTGGSDMVGEVGSAVKGTPAVIGTERDVNSTAAKLLRPVGHPLDLEAVNTTMPSQQDAQGTAEYNDTTPVVQRINPVLPGVQVSRASYVLPLLGCIVVLAMALLFFGRRRQRRVGAGGSTPSNGVKRRRSLGGISRALQQGQRHAEAQV